MTTDRYPLQSFFSPRSIAVYGATNDSDKPGARIFTLLRRYGRPLYAIHPTLESVDGFPVHRSASELRDVLLPFASPKNPIDLTAACSDETYESALDILICAPEVDAILVVAFFAPEGISSRLVNIIATKNRKSRKPMVVFSLYVPFTDQHLLEFHDRGVAAFGSMSRAVEALLALRERKIFIDKRHPGRN